MLGRLTEIVDYAKVELMREVADLEAEEAVLEGAASISLTLL